MTGLLLKDLINLKQQAKVYLIICAIWAVIGFANGDPFFFGGMLMMLTLLVPVSAVAYDEKSKWDRYALTMPISRTQLVLSKYLLALLCALTGFLVTLVFSAVMSGDFWESLAASAALALTGLTMVSILLPLLFRFGTEKGRIIMLAVCLLPLLLISLLPKSGSFASVDALLEKWGFLLIPFAAAIITGSVLISLRIYKHKEF